MSDLGLKRGFVITTGEERRRLGAIEILPFKDIAAGHVELPL